MSWPVALLVWLAVGAWIAWLWGAVAHEPDPNESQTHKREEKFP